jgi:hypothetical protein
MPIAAQSIVRRVVDTLQDTTSIRWPVGELVRYLNDAEREIILYRPDAMVKNAAMTCVAGSRQTIPTDGAKLIEVIRNTASKKAIRLCNREILDAQIPGWHNLTPVLDAVHFMYDPRDPKTVYLYPPVTAAASIDLVYAAVPTPLTEPASGDYTAVTGNLNVPDIYANAVQNYMLARCYLKDSEYAGNAARAQAHYQMFADSLGVEIKATMSFGPTSQGNPNVGRAQPPQA